MFNKVTEQKIKAIPPIGDIDTDRLPQELTKIYAQIVSLRRQVADGRISFKDEDLVSGIALLSQLACNLETILLTNPKHEQKESIAFVAATANSLIHKMGLIDEQSTSSLEIDSLSTYIAAVILFLIGNSQADAAETAYAISTIKEDNPIQHQLESAITSLASGKLSTIVDSQFKEEDVIQEDHLQTALNSLWRALGLGIKQLAIGLLGEKKQQNEPHFDNVIDLCISETGLYGQRSIFSGPYRLAKLLKILEEDIFDRAVIDIPTPTGVDPTPWQTFLGNLAKDRPYLWENHKEAVTTNFLTPGISAVLTLPTGAGKSTLSELKIASCLYSGRKVVYLVPTHALEDQINRNLRPLFPEFEPINIEFGGEYTNIDELDGFPIMVMTPERCLTYLNINPEFFNSVGLVVFDEFHLIHGTNIKKDRRSIDAMYCLLSLFTYAAGADYLLISAMVENGQDIASWLEQITNRECKLFNSTWKPTRQLHGCLAFEQNDIRGLQEDILKKKKLKKTKFPPSKLKKELSAFPHCFFSLKNIWETENDSDYFNTRILDHKINLGIGKYWQLTSNRNVIAAELAIQFSSLGLKTLVFVDSPRNANSTCRSISQAIDYKENNYKEYITLNNHLVSSLTLELGNLEHSYFNEARNVAVHHGLLLPLERTLIEGYFKSERGSVVLVATATLAQGINLPAEIVIIAGDDRYDDGGFRENVKPYELLNAAGRAGRAGLSSQGAVILIPGDIVTIKGSSLSEKWWELKNDVFSKGDQCLNIEDPLRYFLDSLQDNLDELSKEEINILHRFKPKSLSDTDALGLLRKSFYAHKANQLNNTEVFEGQVQRLLALRNELDSLTGEDVWQKEIAVKAGVEPSIIYDLSSSIDQLGVDKFLSLSIAEIIDWFIKWLSSNQNFVEKIFTRQSTLNQLKKTVGLPELSDVKEILPKLDILANTLKNYTSGLPLRELNTEIPDGTNPDRTVYLIKARNFVNRLVPELSFGFGLLAMILIEKAIKNGISKQEIPWDIRALASCIREGFDSAAKLFYKKNNRLHMRVETHLMYNKK